MKKKYVASLLSLCMICASFCPAVNASETDVLSSVSEALLEETIEEADDDEMADTLEAEQESEIVSDEDTYEEQDCEIISDTDVYDELETVEMIIDESDYDADDQNTNFANEAVDTNNTDPTKGYIPLTNATSIEYWYDVDNSTLYFKCAEGVKEAQMPDWTGSVGQTEWLRDLGDKANSIQKIVIGDGITYIGKQNFMCSSVNAYPNLTEVVLADSVQEIGDEAFRKNQLTTINLSNVKKIDDYAFYESGIKTCNSAKLEYIGNNAFSNSKITDVVLESEKVTIGTYAFYQCNGLTSFSAKELLFEEGAKYVFNSCSVLSNFSYAAMEWIPEASFSKTAFTSFNFKGVKKIDQKAFLTVTTLETITFDDQIESIGVNAFRKCDKLKKAAIDNDNVSIGEGAFSSNSSGTGTVPLEAVCYKGTSEQWSQISSNANVSATAKVHCKGDAAPTPATCTEAGDKTSVCAVCGGTYKDENGTEHPAEGHKYSETYEVDKAATCTEAGSESQHCIRCNAIDTASIKEIPATGHKYSKWITTTKATVFTPAVQTSTCDICKKNTTTRKYGSKLNPTIKVSAETVLLKTSQKTSALKVTGLANGDSVKSYQSGNTKLFTVDKKGVITATKKTGNAKLTITLASGLKKNVTVKVQKKAVATTKITGLQSKVTVQKGAKLTLKPSRLPITSTQKFTYASSNKKVATVSSAGVIKAKAAGTAKITVKSGNKKVVVTVTVPKTKTTAITVKTSVTVKKGKTIALNAKKTPANSDQKITYTSANKKIATVTSAGKIKGVKKGTTTITVKSGSITKKVQVTVK